MVFDRTIQRNLIYVVDHTQWDNEDNVLNEFIKGDTISLTNLLIYKKKKYQSRLFLNVLNNNQIFFTPLIHNIQI